MLNAVIDIIFPKKCINCGRNGGYLCEDCLSLVEINPYYYCLCDRPHKLSSPGKCSLCASKNLDGLLSASSFNQELISKMIHKMKYGYLKEMSLLFAYLILTHLQNVEKDISGYSLVPVPLSDAKKRRRGFNQSEEIAKAIAGATSLPFFPDVLSKIKDNKAQAGLNREERMENIKNCFAVKNKDKIENKKILLLDDVYTTGSTMDECARILKESGAKEVIGLSVAREMIEG
jgi:ComF family protein